jgi:4-amino-4-deoxy-L-arabinose transferase-like glycosyltransferase
MPAAAARDRGLLLATGLVVLLPFLGQTRHVASREIRHAEIAREMATSGEWIVPTLLGREYVDKPPVLHALVAGLYRLHGAPSLALARLPSALAAIIGVLAVYGIGSVLAGARAARIAGFGLLALAGYQGMARIARPDMLFVAAILVSCLALLHAMRGRGPATRLAGFVLGGIAAGVAVVVKGPFGIACPVLFALAVPFGRPDLVRPRSHEWAVFGLGAATGVAIWAVPAYLRDGGAYLARVVTQPDLSLHADDVPKPPWLYALVLPVALLPLTLVVPVLVRDVRRRGPTPVLVVGLVLLALFVIAPKRRPHYLLPVYPFIALAVAEAVARDERPGVTRAVAVLIVVALAAFPLYQAIGSWLAPREDSRLVTAHRVLAAVEPGKPIVCLAYLAEEIAFEGRRSGVTLVYDVRDLVREIDRQDATYVVLGDADRARVLASLDGRLALRRLRDAVPGTHADAGLDVYRVDRRAS